MSDPIAALPPPVSAAPASLSPAEAAIANLPASSSAPPAPDKEPIRHSGAPGGFLSSFVDLLNAQAHAPTSSERNGHSSSSDEDEEDDGTESHEAITPRSSLDEEEGFYAPPTRDGDDLFEEPHSYDEEADPHHPAYKHPLARRESDTAADSDAEHGPVRGVSLLNSPPSGTDISSRRPTLTRRGTGLSMTLREVALDQLDSAEAMIQRSQKTKDGDNAGEETFEDPKETDGDLTKAERLATLVEEFGEWGAGKEEFVMSCPGALYRGVLVKGLLALTNRRMFIYAYIPHVDSQKIIRSVHFPNEKFQSKRRTWIELKGDSVTWFRNSRTLYRPLGACRLSQTKAVLPYNPDRPKHFSLELIDGRMREFELDTEESCVAWRNDFEAAIFTFRQKADKLRLALPLHLITRIEIQPYLSMGEKVDVQFESGICSNSDSNSDSDASSAADQGTPQEASFGYLKTHVDFGVALKEQIRLSHQLPIEQVCQSAKPILEIDGEHHVEEEIVHAQTEKEGEGQLALDFVRTFALADKPESIFLSPSCELVRSLPTWGSLCISSKYMCFWRKANIGNDVKLRIPLADIDDVGPCKAFGFRIVGLAIQVRGAPDVRLDFHSKKRRDLVIETLKNAVLTIKASTVATTSATATNGFTPPVSGPVSEQSVPTLSGLTLTLSTSSSSSSPLSRPSSTTTPPTSPGGSTSAYTMSPVLNTWAPKTSVVLGQELEERVDLPPNMSPRSRPTMIGSTGTKTLRGLHFFCLTIGSRGDVQPYISLGLELMKDGNRVTIASHPEYREWVEGYGINYKEVGGDPAALMKLSVEHKMFSPGFFRESLGHFRQWLDDLFRECWEACQEADILIESPSTMAGIHVAEALGIPYFRAFTMPWSKTSTYPQAFAASVDLGPTYNQLSYTLYDSIIWKATAGQVNRWRRDMLGLKPTSLHKMSQAKTPFIYNFSSAVVPKPNDWRDFIYISGYWFLNTNEDSSWDAPAGLLDFIAKARSDGKPVIYIGFGSIVVPDSAAVTRAVIKAVQDSDVRAILSKGWSDRGAAKTEEVELPSEIFSVRSIEHDKLFPMIDAACHHGGAGTTGASLRAGLPTLIHPFFGDQYFWATRVQKLSAGVKINSLSASDLTAAFKQGTRDRIMKEKAEAIGVKIRSENGPRDALTFIYEHIHLAQERADLRARRARLEKDPEKHSSKPSPRSLTPTRVATLPSTVEKCPLPRWRSKGASGTASDSEEKRTATLPNVAFDRSSTMESTESAATV